jgi:hypothetical protein
MTNNRETQSATPHEYFGLLDAIVVVAEAWKLLVIACVLAVAAGYAYFQLQPKLYESNAVVSLDAVQLARFSSPEFLQQTGVDTAMWNLDISHVGSPVASVSTPYEVSFRAGSPEAAQSGLDAVIQAFTAEIAVDVTQNELLQRSKTRILKAIDDLDLISTRLAAEAETTMPGSESELYARSVVMLLDQQAKREEELLAVELKLRDSAGIAVIPPSMPATEVPRSLRAPLIASVGVAVFLVLCFAFGREAVRRASRSAAGAEKLQRLRRAFSFRGA